MTSVAKGLFTGRAKLMTTPVGKSLASFFAIAAIITYGPVGFAAETDATETRTSEHLAVRAGKYQTAEPKMDTRLDSAEPPLAPDHKSAAAKPAGPLVGGVQHNQNVKPKKLKFLGGARRAESKPLNASVKDQALNAQAQSSIGIVGVKFISTVGHAPVINLVFPGTPAQKVGFQVNDVIVAVDGVPTTGLSKDEIFDLIVGTPGTSVTISINRRGEFMPITCTRMDINELTDPRVRRDYLMSM